MPDTKSVTTVLVASPHEEDHAELQRILSDAGWRICGARSLEQAWRLLHETGIDIVITECEFADGLSWKDLLEEIENMHGSEPVIVVSRHADGRLWAEVLNRGGYDLLLKPFDAADVLRVTAMAARRSAETAVSAVA